LARKIKPNPNNQEQAVQIDVFNGDADGVCALVQLRLAQPAKAKLVSGVKRDIQLLERLSIQKNDSVTVLDISLKKNRIALDRILQQGATVFYVDHHESGDIPQHTNLKAIINTAANTCTSLLVDQYLENTGHGRLLRLLEII
jgi:oligoribonuclease NrnB/cAMP/cGMP phosphodiesterase (DHH superfamily)